MNISIADFNTILLQCSSFKNIWYESFVHIDEMKRRIIVKIAKSVLSNTYFLKL